MNKDQSGRSVLVQITKTASPEIKSEANSALKTLDEARQLINIAELGTAQPDSNYLKAHPEYTAHLDADEAWAKSTVKNLGMSSPLAVSILEDTSLSMGSNFARKLVTTTSAVVTPPLNTRERQAAWLTKYLDMREQYFQELPQMQKFLPALQKRLSRYRDLIKSGDWELKSVSAQSIGGK